ncbi:MAG TPA: hypothetical protein VNC50_18635 [Planctomycetia bacterium]|nr:hypothetical protein [Planctomycetia bacterium]
MDDQPRQSDSPWPLALMLLIGLAIAGAFAWRYQSAKAAVERARAIAGEKAAENVRPK